MNHYEKLWTSAIRPIKVDGFIGVATDFFRWMVDSKYRITQRSIDYLRFQWELDQMYPMIFKQIEAESIKISKKSKTKFDCILNIQIYIKTNFKYKSDWAKNSREEMWEDMVNVWQTKEGDCESLNTLLRMMCILAGLTVDSIWCAIGLAGGVGHFWLLYLATEVSNTEPVFFSIDATMFTDYTKLEDRVRFQITPKMYQDIWYVFNENWSGKWLKKQ